MPPREETIFEPQLSHPVSTPVYSTTARTGPAAVAAAAVSEEEPRRRPGLVIIAELAVLVLLVVLALAMFGGKQTPAIATVPPNPTAMLA